ncbi:MAG: high frequency lysogenization protein HflD [Gammaproteobacteria bacterium]|nr:MAG: high frequency lysogenization protein HflD [Gammaproteobacteria bacterium]
MDNLESRTLALAGVFRAAALVDLLANEGTISDEELRISVESIFETDPEDVIQVFGEINNLSTGFQTLINQLGKDSQHRNIDIARYVVSMLFLERQLMKIPVMLETLSNGVELAARQSEHFSTTHENVIANLADLYTRTISELGPRIMVNGEQSYLETTAISNKIRTVLLAGIRSAVLWQQLGGRRWHVIFNRRRYLKIAGSYLEND